MTGGKENKMSHNISQGCPCTECFAARHNLATSFPVPDKEVVEKAIRELEKSKKLLPIPPGTTSIDFQGMKIIPGQRISWDIKNKHVDMLGQLYADGYLSAEEYDNRIEWVWDSQTQAQIDVAFMDLKDAQREKNAAACEKKTQQKTKITYGTYLAIIYMLAVIVIIILFATNTIK